MQDRNVEADGAAAYRACPTNPAGLIRIDADRQLDCCAISSFRFTPAPVSWTSSAKVDTSNLPRQGLEDEVISPFGTCIAATKSGAACHSASPIRPFQWGRKLERRVEARKASHQKLSGETSKERIKQFASSLRCQQTFGHCGQSSCKMLSQN